MKKFALNLAADNRVLSVTFDEYAPPEQPRVDILPEGDITEYLYINGSFKHEPLPIPPGPPAEPTQLDKIEAQAMYTAMMTNTLIGGDANV